MSEGPDFGFMDADEITEFMGWDHDSRWLFVEQFFTEKNLHDEWEDFLRKKAKEENVACTDVEDLEPLKDGHLGDLMTWEEFVEGCRTGAFIDADGFAEFATATHVSAATFDPSDVGVIEKPDWATHVVWYNR